MEIISTRLRLTENRSQTYRELEAEGVSIAAVVTDWLMPGIKGDELLETINRKNPSVKSVIITAMETRDSLTSQGIGRPCKSHSETLEK
jgi:DNA-binding NtrC family response regulator